MARRHRRNRYRQKQERETKKSPQVTSNDGVGKTSVFQPRKTQPTSTSFTWCRHWEEPVTLLDGLTISASAWTDRPGRYKSDTGPVPPRGDFTFGVYFDTFWHEDEILVSATWPGIELPVVKDDVPKVMVPWIDRRAPNDIVRFETVVDWLLERLKAGDKIEIGCFAAHGRTGTMLACLLVKQGLNATGAINKVRSEYCWEAIESVEQSEFVHRLANRLGRTQPETDGQLSIPLPERTTTHRFDSDGFCLKCFTFDCYDELKQPEPAGRYEPETINLPHVLDSEDFCKTHLDWIENCARLSEAPPVDDRDEYQAWLRLNTIGIEEAKATGWKEEDLEKAAQKLNGLVEQVEQKRNPNERVLPDEELNCIQPPCAYKGECNIAEGECWKAVTYRGVAWEEDMEWD